MTRGFRWHRNDNHPAGRQRASFGVFVALIEEVHRVYFSTLALFCFFDALGSARRLEVLKDTAAGL